VIDLITEYAWAATSPAQRADDWHRDYARIQPHAVSLTPESLGWEFPQGGTLDFVSAARLAGRGEDEAEKTRDDDRPEDDGYPVVSPVLAYRDHRGDPGERDAVHEGQP
uniref:hypothetical protein n=1 Tax=Streptomyces sp. NRRL S-1896 TaxID=1463893 RepID=UPI002D21B98F